MTYRTLIINAIKEMLQNYKRRILNNEKNYIFVGMGIPPANLQDVFNKVITDENINCLFTFEVTLIRFKSNEKLSKINEIFSSEFSLDTYILAEENKNLRHFCASGFFEYLRMPHQKRTLTDAQNTINDINYYINQAQNLNDMGALLQDPNQEEENEDEGLIPNDDEETEQKGIDEILDKVNKDGIESLNQDEKKILDDYRKNL
mgnify:CR=1 FL=1|jgi:hypothetical protein